MVALSPSGRYLACASQAGEIVVWDRDGEEPPVAPFQSHTAMITHLAVADGWLLSASEDQWVRIWDLSRGNCLHQYRHVRDVVRVARNGPTIFFADGGDGPEA